MRTTCGGAGVCNPDHVIANVPNSVLSGEPVVREVLKSSCVKFQETHLLGDLIALRCYGNFSPLPF